MPSITVSAVSFAHSDAVPLIRDLSLRLETGWAGVVGPNGCGKTTLLQLLDASLEPDTGQIRRHPSGLSVSSCPQTVETVLEDVRVLARACDGVASRLRGELDLDAETLARWESLSPGERKRWQVGAALYAEPDVLILDEPTNHLDTEARDRLIAVLLGFRGIGVLVSHDRALLDALTQNTLRFCEGEIRLWRGSYATARESWEQEEREQIAAYQSLQAEKRKLRRRTAVARQRRAQSEAKMRREMRRAGPKDIDTRMRFSQKRRRSAEASQGWEVHKLNAKLSRLEERSASFELHKALGRSLFPDWEPAGVARLLSLDLAELRVGRRVLLRDVHLQFGRESRVHILGPNGAGKTSLVNSLLARAQIPESRILHLPQEISQQRGADLLRDLHAAAPEQQSRVLSILAALGVDPAALLASARPSPGETRKLALSFGFARRVWALILDEPTNHLDLPSVERIETALAAYPGALLVVTHDQTFAERITNTVWKLDSGSISVHSRDS